MDGCGKFACGDARADRTAHPTTAPTGFIETVTLAGKRQYILAVVEHTTRRIRVLGTTTHPTADGATADGVFGTYKVEAATQPSLRALTLRCDRSAARLTRPADACQMHAIRSILGSHRLGGASGMSERMRVDTDELNDAAPVFHRQSGQLQDALHTLHTQLASLGAPWGDDEQGNKFHGKYGPAKDGVDSAAKTLVTGLESIGDALKAMAENHDENERATKDAFDSATKER